MAVQVGGCFPQRGGSADHRDVRLVAAGELDEPREDDTLAQLVFRAPDHHDGAYRPTVGGRGKPNWVRDVGHVSSVYRRPHCGADRRFLPILTGLSLELY